MTTLPPSAQAVLVAPTRNSMVKLEHPKTLHRLSVVLFGLYAWLLVWVIALKCNLIAPVTDNYYKFGDWTWAQKWQFVGESFKALFVENEWGKDYDLHPTREEHAIMGEKLIEAVKDIIK